MSKGTYQRYVKPPKKPGWDELMIFITLVIVTFLSISIWIRSLQ